MLQLRQEYRGLRRTLILAIAILFAMVAQLANAQPAPPLVITEGQSLEEVEDRATYLLTPENAPIGVEEARQAFAQGRFTKEREFADEDAGFDRSLWIALPLKASESNPNDIRRIVGIGGNFMHLPNAYLVADDGRTEEILVKVMEDQQELKPRYFTYVGTASFALEPGEEALVLLNLARHDTPSLGLFRENELGQNQMIAVLLVVGARSISFFVGMMLVAVATLSRKPAAFASGLFFCLVALQSSLYAFATAFAPDPQSANLIWRTGSYLFVFILAMMTARLWLADVRPKVKTGLLTGLAIILALLGYVIIFHAPVRMLVVAIYLAILPQFWVIGVKLEVALRLRLVVFAMAIFAFVTAVLVEPDLVGYHFPDLFVDVVRVSASLPMGLALLAVVLVDFRQELATRERLSAERIAALEAQAETDQRLLQTEREYARARETALRRKQQLASASHDIRQPLVGLRAAIREEADSLSPQLQHRLGDAIDYLEELTGEYSDREKTDTTAFDDTEEAYSLELIVQTVEDMFAGEAAKAGIAFETDQIRCMTRVPALALIRATSNLVANTLRHAEASRISLSVRHEDRCQIVISDNGCGMDEATLAEVQNRGAKGDTSQGDGLGLAIVHDLARRYGFTFSIESEPSKGTVATLTLPAN